jgi:hypothetical protein
MNNLLGIFIVMAGYIVGLGAVTVIDILGFLGRKSSYWTEATIRAHKVTKPLIWVGIFLVCLGGLILNIPQYLFLIYFVLILNGLFLSFYVSPILLDIEKKHKQKQLLPNSLQEKIVLSFIVSDLGWWGSLFLFLKFLNL